MSKITTWCRINVQSFVINGKETIITGEVGSNPNLQLYKQLGIEYPKFHKMDALSKMAFLGTELLLSHNINQLKEQDDVALLFANSESSEYSDQKFVESYQNTTSPSPSHFVYTLPNIMLGELAIRNLWYGENLFLFQSQIDADEICQNIQLLFNNGYNYCIFAWINVLGSKPDAFFSIIEKNENPANPFAPSQLLELYTQ